MGLASSCPHPTPRQDPRKRRQRQATPRLPRGESVRGVRQERRGSQLVGVGGHVAWLVGSTGCEMRGGVWSV
eukprot:1209797-Rhodomonas_salina.4